MRTAAQIGRIIIGSDGSRGREFDVLYNEGASDAIAASVYQRVFPLLYSQTQRLVDGYVYGRLPGVGDEPFTLLGATTVVSSSEGREALRLRALILTDAVLERTAWNPFSLDGDLWSWLMHESSAGIPWHGPSPDRHAVERACRALRGLDEPALDAPHAPLRVLNAAFADLPVETRRRVPGFVVSWPRDGRAVPSWLRLCYLAVPQAAGGSRPQAAPVSIRATRLDGGAAAVLAMNTDDQVARLYWQVRAMRETEELREGMEELDGEMRVSARDRRRILDRLERTARRLKRSLETLKDVPGLAIPGERMRQSLRHYEAWRVRLRDTDAMRPMARATGFAKQYAGFIILVLFLAVWVGCYAWQTCQKSADVRPPARALRGK